MSSSVSNGPQKVPVLSTSNKRGSLDELGQDGDGKKYVKMTEKLTQPDPTSPTQSFTKSTEALSQMGASFFLRSNYVPLLADQKHRAFPSSSSSSNPDSRSLSFRKILPLPMGRPPLVVPKDFMGSSSSSISKNMAEETASPGSPRSPVANISQRKVPKAPVHLSYNRARYDECLFLKKLTALSSQIATARVNRQPLELEISPGHIVKVRDIQEIGRGDNSIAYTCLDETNTTYVMKVLSPRLNGAGQIEDPRAIVSKFANQLRRYAQYMAIASLKPHIAKHFNLDPYVESAQMMIDSVSYMDDKEEVLEEELRGFVMQNIACPVHFCEYVPDAFPAAETCEPSAPSSAWSQLKNIFQLMEDHNVAIDLSRSNTRTDNGFVKVVDLFEITEDLVSTLYPKLIRTFVPDQKAGFLRPTPRSAVS
ncbi:MAG: hypothetical protein K1X28_04260 [Parachlamydiales bacterium]|nr:hypothetical protein [Parachlamydiales bacterium]